MDNTKFLNKITINKLMPILIVGYFLTELFYFNNPLGSFNNFYNKIQIADYFYLIVLVVFLVKFIISKNKKDFFNFDTFEKLPLLFLFFCILTSLFAMNGIPASQFLKYIYLISIFYIVRNVSIEVNSFKIIINYVFYILIIYFFILFLSYLTAVISKSSNFFVMFYDNFPYVDELYRLKGGYSPTSKLLAFHLFLATIFLYMFREFFSEKKKYILLFLIFTLATLTFSRAGFVVGFLSVYVFLRLLKSRYLIYSFVPIIILSFISLEILSLLFFESNNLLFVCEQSFQPNQINQRFGWFGKEFHCNLDLNLNIYQDGYLILKLVGINAGFDNFLFGNGLGSYDQIWISAATENLIPSYFLNYVFPMSQSTLVTLFAENGMTGLLIFMAFLFGSISKGACTFKNLDVFIMCLSLFFIILNLDIQNFRFLYFYLGIFYAYHYLNKRELI
jgi:hypothetical protein